MVAKDSPLLIDCPPAKRGAITTAHGTLDAAILKLRMAAYMWQALTAEDLRQKNLGRRSFRLDEEWGPDTTTMASSYLQSDPKNTRMGSIARVHVVRSDKTVDELRSAEVAQQNHRAPSHRRDELHKDFEQALIAHGHPFVGASRPVVAGLILDSHYSLEKDLILAHAALGYHKEDGLSLGVFGSHTTYAWPRFLEEVPACLLDLTPTGDTVGNDNGQCTTMQGACFVGQGAMLHEVGHAFGAEHTRGIMSRGYAKSWGKVFIAQKGSEDHEAKWDLQDALRFLTNEHFRLPGDETLTQSQKDNPVLRCTLDENHEPLLEATCRAGLARVQFTDDKGKVAWEIDFCRKAPVDQANDEITVRRGPSVFRLSVSELEKKLDHSKPCAVQVLSMNGNICKTKNLWMFLADQPFIKVPGTSLILSKRSVRASALDGSGSDDQYWKWAMLLKRKHRDGGGSRLTYANRIDLRIGATMDGAVVYYADGSKCNCGKAYQTHYGGHQSQDQSLSEDEVFEITRVTLNKGDAWGSGTLNGCRMRLSSGQSWGAINGGRPENHNRLEPTDDERIIGFYGQSDPRNGFPFEFGIITAPKSVVDSDEGLPRQIYDMPELMNTDGGLGGAHQNPDHADEDEDEDEDDNSEDDSENDSENDLDVDM